MNLQSNDFELFELPARFSQDRAAIDAQWKALQRQAHPDKFAAQAGTAQRLAMQWSVRINEAYQRLKDPLRRAAYLCELHGSPINAENNTAMPVDFLMQQIEWREALDEATTLADLEAISDRAIATSNEALAKVKQCIDDESDFPHAVQWVRSLMFLERFSSEVDMRIDQLGQ